MKLEVKKYKTEGDIAWEYVPLRNLKTEDNTITNFRVNNDSFKLNLSNPIDIECQPSYDGTVNLIINDDSNPPRIINSRFSLLENNRYKIINRNQIKQSNLYKEGTLDRETRLFRNINNIPKFELNKVSYFGQLMGGNYTFYLKYLDDDFNQTDIVAETGIISIFHGSFDDVKTCHGAFMDERTDKSIILNLSNIDTSFSYFNLYFTRSSCDDTGTEFTKAYKININYEIDNDYKLISINGFEELIDISIEELNIQYNIVDRVKSQAQVQNRLFFANVDKPHDKNEDLRNLSLYIEVEEYQLEKSIGYVDPKNFNIQTGDSTTQSEYYSPYNIYYRLGYFPKEIYRFGIVYIFNDDHLSPTYNLRGIDFYAAKAKGVTKNYKLSEDESEDESEDKSENKSEELDAIKYKDFLDNSGNLTNTYGVFRLSDATIIDHEKKTINPLGLKFTIPENVIKKLKAFGIKGYFFVRQKRIPTLIAQGYSIGVDKVSYAPMLYKDGAYFTESFINSNRVLTTTYKDRIVTTDRKQSSGLLCVDSYVDRQIQSLFNSSDFYLEPVKKFDVKTGDFNNYYYTAVNIEEEPSQYKNNVNLLYIDTEVPQKIYNDYGFSTKVGMQEDLRQISCFGIERLDDEKATNYIRGLYTAFVGTTDNLDDNCLYNIYISNYTESALKEYFTIRMRDRSPFFACSERFDLNDVDHTREIFRGDCFTNTVCQRIQRNFTSTSVHINDHILEPNSWKENFKGIASTEDWDEINKADVDAVPIGHWFTYKCVSNYNLGLRSRDSFNSDEIAVMGNPRGFYPIDGISTKSSNKIPESNLYNKGYHTSLGVRRSFAFERMQYIKDEYDTRIMFSNVQVDGAFKNSYKIFQGLSFEDYDRQYGGITKILPWNNNLLCVFEHAIAIVPVNEKALVQTTTSQNIHMYGDGVLQKQLTLISDMYGSSWKDSIIRTPLALYGVDTSAKKIWKFDKSGFTTISDFSIQRWLTDNMNLKELEKSVILGSRNVKTHYNAYKQDVMFTFYNKDKIWNLCYNEVRKGWVTRYSWTPLLSENINNSFFSFDLLKTKIFGIINNNLYNENSELKVNEEWKGIWKKDETFKTLKLSIDENRWSGFNSKSIIVKGYRVNKETNEIVSDVICTLNDPVSTDLKFIEVYNDSITFSRDLWDDKEEGSYIYFTVEVTYIPYINVVQTVLEKDEKEELQEVKETITVENNNTKTETFGLIIEYDNDLKCKEDWQTALLYSIYVHGRSVTADEINYFNYVPKGGPDDQILPTKWYDRQEKFEFEFVVNDPKGLHKIFDNLLIVSNNVEPETLQIEIVGDVYDFNKRKIFVNEEFNEELSREKIETEFEPVVIKSSGLVPDPGKDIIYKTEVKWDPILDEYSLLVSQDLANIKKYGRRLGNIYYNEDAWYIVIQPIYYTDIINGNPGRKKSTRIRDKWAKIRVIYSGKKIAIITAIQTIMTQSYV